MRRQRWWLPLLAVVFITNWKSTLTLPVPDEELDTSTKLLGSSVVTSVSVVTGSSEHGTPVSSHATSTADRRRVMPSKELPGSPADHLRPDRFQFYTFNKEGQVVTKQMTEKGVIPSKELPGSPAGLLRPDRFQFYTFNKEGQVVTKQMTEKEIQGLIAADGGHLPMEIYEPQSAGDVPSGGMKVADVVQNVQNVLKGELSKPPTVMTSVPTIPGHVNTEWSSILPAILGGESDTAPLSETAVSDTSIVAATELINKPTSQPTTTKVPDKQPSATVDYATKKKPSGISETDVHSEKPMIQVPVITVDQKLPAHHTEEDSMPVFQMLNTISADKVKSKNKTSAFENSQTAKPPKTDLPIHENNALELEKASEKPAIVEAPVTEQSTPVEEKLPEMIEISFNSGNVEPAMKKPIVKPETPIKISETVSKSPESEPPATVSVVSETHSTSMKVSGHEEVPLRDPAKPVDYVQIISEKKPEKVTEITTTEKMGPTTVKSEATTERTTTEAPEKPGLFAQGVSFFGNLPETVSSIVSDLISNNPPTVASTAEDSDAKEPTKNSVNESVGTTTSPKIPESTDAPMKETNTGIKEETVYQMMPEILPNKKRPPHGASPSEASSIEHIIETLNDPTGSISGTVAADHFMVHTTADEKVNDTKPDATPASSEKPATLVDSKTSTSAAPITVETPVESSSVKPVEALPTELADSLSSMISQISDAMPSVLPVNQQANFDATEKKNGVSMNAEEVGATEVTKATEVPAVSKSPEEPAKKNELTTQAESDKSDVVVTKAPEVNEPTTDITDASTQKSKESATTTDVPAIPESSKFDSSITTTSGPPSSSNETPEISANESDLPVSEKLQGPVSKPENLKPEADELQASSDITTDKVTPEVKPVDSAKIEDATKSATTSLVEVEKTTTPTPTTTIASSSTIISDRTERPTTVKLESVSTIAPKTQKPEDETNEDSTELPIVRIDIKEGKPTDFKNANNSQGNSANADNGTQSPLVRIQLMANPVKLINNMIESASVDTSLPPVESLTLPKTGSVPANTIGSGLIAGFPSTTTQPTTNNAETTPEVSQIAIESVKSEPEVQLVNDAPVIDGGIPVATTIQAEVENITKIAASESPVIAEETVTENISISEVSTLKDSSLGELANPVERIELPKEPVAAESTEKATTLQADTTLYSSTDKPKNEEKIFDITTTKIAEVEASTSPPDVPISSLTLADNVSTVAEETTTKISAVEIIDAVENRVQLPVSSTSGKPVLDDDKVNEASKIIETTVSTSVKPEITTQPESTVISLKNTTAANPDESPESNTPIKLEAPVVRIEVAPETLAEEIPPRIQLTDLPIVETTASPKKPVKDDGIQTFLTTEITQSVTTMQSPVESTENNSEASSNVSLQTTTLSSTDSTAKIEHIAKKPENSDVNNASSDSSEKVFTPPETEEIRIQVNDTAVLVTKRPVSETVSQKVGGVEKIPENQEQSTTPKIASATEVSDAKLVESVETLPVPVKLTDSPTKNNSATADSMNTKVVISGSETEMLIPLGDDQEKKKISAPPKLDDSRKPIKKNNDEPLSIDEKTTIVPKPNDDKSADREEESTTSASMKVDITTSASLDKAATPKITALPTKSGEQHPSSDKDVTIRVTVKPTSRPTKPAHKPTMNIKKDDAIPKPAEDKWTLIPQQVYPALTKTGAHVKRPITPEVPSTVLENDEQKVQQSTERPPVPLDHPQSASGLESTVKNLETDISYFANLCNELAFSFWTATNKGLSTARSLAVSPFGMTSMLAMVFLGARGPTSDQMNDILRLDDVASFNPHLVFQNVTDAVSLARNQGVANAAFVRELFADRLKVRKLMPFYKDQAQQFYDGLVAEVNFATISDIVRRRTNLMIRKQTGGRIKDFVRTNTVPLRSPLAALSANVFQTDCNSSAASSEGRDGELYFAVSPAVRQRKLVPVPATVWRAGVLAGYEPSLDATAMALGGTDKLVSTIFVMPGQQGHTAPGDTLDRLEQRVVKGAAHDGAWNKLLKVLIPRPGLELQVPKFSHRSVINATAALKRMGLEELFSKHADLKGINGVATDLHLADVLQMNLFSTCGDENIISGRHHVEVYPGSPLRNARDYHESADESDEFRDDLDKEQESFAGSATLYESVSHREARSPRQNDGADKPRLKLDRPFLYFVRHNPTGLILHMGRFNPRLLP